jgi:hypothetical protein
MEKQNLTELHEKIRAIVAGEGGDPLTQCLKGQLKIVLQALEGWESLASLIPGSDL